ncbi:MAG TPA: 4-hydroxythreonine-4-phosphate dehydrogenase PdxA [Planctomycetaceae bacterium]|nr:4-hydroxythreonine-4-phosphate dehydrogenase PdxA [Planctomycetaceae bacterium]
MTLGDPAGVGPELTLAALLDPEVQKFCVPVLIGNVAIAERYFLHCGQSFPDVPRWSVAEFLHNRPSEAGLVDVPFEGDLDYDIGQISADCGRAAFSYVETAIAAAQTGSVDAVTTGPLNKQAMHLAGIDFPGHTEIFAERTQSTKWCMMQYSDEVTCTFATVHCGYADVPRLLTEQRVLDTIELTAAAMQALHNRPGTLVVCGLNPHAGENGLFGQEEKLVIEPAIARARAQGIDIHGPVPPDTAFLPARRACTDAFVCMYHDQGHIPLKALAFDRAVNTTLGLPIIRTSVDHGTAFDIAWKGTADSGSLYAALKLAARLVQKAGMGNQ